MVQKYGCGSRNANNREPDTKRIKPQSPISLNDNPIMFSINRAALQPSGGLLHEDKHHPFTRKKPFNKTKKVPELHSQSTCSFLQKTVLKN